jgi:putative transcriptional regulator
MSQLLDIMSGSPYIHGMGRSSAEGRRNLVRRARLLADLTQAELADAVGVTRQTIVAIEAGDYAPSVYLALAVSRRLGSTVEDLFGAEPETPTAERRKEMEIR